MKILCALALFALAWSWPGQARAELPRRVQVTVIADEGGVAAVVRERLGALHVEAEIVTSPRFDVRAALTPRADAPALARVFVDMSGGDALLVIVDGAWERALLRRIPRDRGDEVTREQVGLVLASAIEALLEGGKVGIERARVVAAVAPPEPPPPAPVAATGAVAPPEPPPPAPVAATPRPTAPSARGGLTFDARAGYELALFSAQALVVHGPVGSLGVRAMTGEKLAFGARLLGQLRLPIDAEATSVGAHIMPVATRAIVSVEQRLWRSWFWSPQLGFGLDLTHISPFALGPGGQPSEERWRVDAILRAGVGIVLRTAVSISLSALIDVDVADKSYVVSRPGGDATVLEPYPVRPGLGLEIGTP